MKLVSRWAQYYRENRILVCFVIILDILAWIDFLDLGKISWFVGYGILAHKDAAGLIAFWVGAPLVLTLFEAFQANQEAQKQTELEIRPYMRLAWDSGPAENVRNGQGVQSTCLRLVNDGRGIMRQIYYMVKINGKVVQVKNHAIISVGSSTWVVYMEKKDIFPLGNPDYSTHIQKVLNDNIISKEKIEIEGTYQNVNEDRYGFRFVSDPSQQSWFKEDGLQKKIK
ncbi:MAG: hypothetical protein ABIP54_04945 [Candidatus Andersenbacteria bacterium]